MIIYVPHPAVRTLFMHHEIGEKRENLMIFLHEYDLWFKLVHTIKGDGLCQVVAEARDAPKKDLSDWEQEIEM